MVEVEICHTFGRQGGGDCYVLYYDAFIKPRQSIKQNHKQACKTIETFHLLLHCLNSKLFKPN